MSDSPVLKSLRQPCLVPFCRRTRPNDGRFGEWICGLHWRGVSAFHKAEKRRWDRLARKAAARGRDLPRITARAAAAWQACWSEAIEAAGGIAS